MSGLSSTEAIAKPLCFAGEKSVCRDRLKSEAAPGHGASIQKIIMGLKVRSHLQPDVSCAKEWEMK